MKAEALMYKFSDVEDGTKFINQSKYIECLERMSKF